MGANIYSVISVVLIILSRIVGKLENSINFKENVTGHIPPRPDKNLTLTATPDPYETADPTTQARVVLRKNLFSDRNGRIKYYALLLGLEACRNKLENGTWNSNLSWPQIPNSEQEDEFYQVTPEWWKPFPDGVFVVSYILGDGQCYGNYCNKPLKEKTKYGLKIRAFTDSGFQDTDVIPFETLEHLPLSRIIPVIGGLFIITAALVCLSIFEFEWVKRLKVLSGGKSKEAFSPVPVALSHKAFLKYTQQLLSTPGRLGNEFHLLGTLSSDVSTLCLHAQRSDNRKKNRYGNILPFDMTRVKLSLVDDDPSTDYINASFIKGYSQEVEYIACQGPMEETCHDFYRMIIEQNIEVIVMLTEISEKGEEKCFKYYPDLEGVLRIKDIIIVCKQIDEFEFCTKRLLLVKRFGKHFLVTQLHFKQWADFECPDNSQVMLKFCDLVHKTSKNGCILVHCSAGAGRTGTFIAIDILLQNVKNNNKISVFNTVLKLRQQRINLVQNETQLGYIYKCISNAVEESTETNWKITFCVARMRNVKSQAVVLEKEVY